jgi:Cu/Ag efflux pump CusA
MQVSIDRVRASDLGVRVADIAMAVRLLMSGQDLISTFKEGAEQYPADTTENLRSLGTFIHFGKLNILDLGDLTHDKEMQLMCPVNKIGKVDIYVVPWRTNSP